MQRVKLQNRMGLLIFCIFVLNFLSTKFYWYSSVWWFDMLMHFLGGFFVLLLVSYMFPPKSNALKHILVLIFYVLLVGIAWEVFEYIFNNIVAGLTFYTLDTLSDILFDVLGGLVGILYFTKRIMPQEQDKV